MARLPSRQASPAQQVVVMQGGLDLVSPALLIKPGYCIAGENYEPTVEGYARCEGYERFDGHLKPSDATGADVEARRAVIAAPTGSGPIRGVATFRGDVYCWRDNAGGTAGQMFKATATGWALQAFGATIEFTAGSTEFTEGATLTGGTSGATATIRRVVLTEGAWDGSGVGYLVVSGTSGTFGSETITGGGGSASTSGGATAITLPAGGTYRSIVENFYALEGQERLYFVNGVGRAHEWDGTVLAPIRTTASASADKPAHIGVQRGHLALARPGGRLILGSTGTPLEVRALTGAAEIGVGQEITGLVSKVKDSLIVAGRNQVMYLAGADATEFDLRFISESSGAVEGSLQVVGNPIFLDDLGLRDMAAAQSYGDWRMGTITRMVQPMIQSKREAGLDVAGSFRVRSKDQYRIYWGDNTGLCVYFGRKNPECMALRLEFTPTCFHSGEDSAGNEILFAGGDDGMVYQLDAGTSFDGDNLSAYIRLAFTNQGAPNMEKRYHRALIEGTGGSTNSVISTSAEFSYAKDLARPSRTTEFTIHGSGGFWDEANWDEFNWDAAVEGQAAMDLDGIGENVSIAFLSDAADETPHVFSAVTINYSPRRRLR